MVSEASFLFTCGIRISPFSLQWFYFLPHFVPVAYIITPLYQRLRHHLCLPQGRSFQSNTSADFRKLIEYEDFSQLRAICARKKPKTYNRRDSLVVTDPTTNLPIRGLFRGERTGSQVFLCLWPYVLDLIWLQVYDAWISGLLLLGHFLLCCTTLFLHHLVYLAIVFSTHHVDAEPFW